MRQYCRYCANCAVRDEALYICLDENHQLRKWLNNQQIRRVNKCEMFSLNEIAVDNHDLVYKPIEARKRNKSTNGQQQSFDLIKMGFVEKVEG